MRFLTEFIFETFDEALNTHKYLFKMVREQGYVSYADLYLHLHPDEKLCKDIYHIHGWVNLWDAKVEPVEDCVNGQWILKLPKIIILKNKIK